MTTRDIGKTTVTFELIVVALVCIFLWGIVYGKRPLADEFSEFSNVTYTKNYESFNNHTVLLAEKKKKTHIGLIVICY